MTARRCSTPCTRLGSSPTAGEHLLPPALAALAVRPLSVEVLLDEGEPGELVPRAHDGDLDVALVHRYTRVPVRRPWALTVTPLLREDRIPLLRRAPGGRAGEVRLGELADATWVSPAGDRG